jgi:2-amino-4-hydroxy-6-hydroxymethyldihydropteridine diphosphokinase
MTRVYVGLGANVGERAANIATAIEALRQRGLEVLAVSPLYETEPWGVLDQPRFLNGVCVIETLCPPPVLLDALKAIEVELGRMPTLRYGPRPIDLDILLYGELRMDTPRLTIPHAGMLTRATVLTPLVDLAPELRHPLTGLTMREHLARLGPIEGVAPFPPGLPPKVSSRD